MGSDSHQDTYSGEVSRLKKGIQILSLFFALAHIFSSSLALIQELVDMKTGDFVFLCIAFCKHHGTYVYQVSPCRYPSPMGQACQAEYHTPAPLTVKSGGRKQVT